VEQSLVVSVSSGEWTGEAVKISLLFLFLSFSVSFQPYRINMPQHSMTNKMLLRHGGTVRLPRG
jgi:hypothetical protein